MKQNTLIIGAIVVLLVIGGGFILLRQPVEPDEQPDTPEPQTPPVVDGVVGDGEYTHEASAAGVTVHWMNTEELLYVALISPGTGWVSIGIDPDTAMKGANYIFGYVEDGETFVSDEYGVSNYGHKPDTGEGGMDDIQKYAGTEGDGTVIEFVIPLDSGDALDKPLTSGESYRCIVAVHGSADDFSSKHTGIGTVTISID